jgi:phosphate transport system substrate-binding protein
VAALVVGCGGGATDGLSGTIEIDGSSTVFPITEAVAEEFSREQRGVRVTVGVSGTGGGFQKFCNGETAIQDASRPISASEVSACQAKGVDYIELPVAYDALSIVVHPRNDWANCITIAELRKMWEPAAQRQITRWNQVREDWPDASLKLFGPGTDSGTFDYFTERVNGKAKDSRGDFTASEDDNVLVTGIAGDRYALGYFGLAYYAENRSKVKALQVDGGRGCITASAETVEGGSYPLSRPLFIYVRRDEVERAEVKAFVDFYLRHAGALAGEVGYVKLPERLSSIVMRRWQQFEAGSIYANAPAGATLEQLLTRP